jgi:hypothetical protein
MSEGIGMSECKRMLESLIFAANSKDFERASYLERQIWMLALETCARSTNRGDHWHAADIATIALRTRSVEFPRGYAK